MAGKRRSRLYGLGFDHQDGHVRVTKGKNYLLCGGSQQTHGVLQETAVKINERLDRRGKSLDEVSEAEFHDIAHEIGLKPVPHQKSPHSLN